MQVLVVFVQSIFVRKKPYTIHGKSDAAERKIFYAIFFFPKLRRSRRSICRRRPRNGRDMRVLHYHYNCVSVYRNSAQNYRNAHD